MPGDAIDKPKSRRRPGRQGSGRQRRRRGRFRIHHDPGRDPRHLLRGSGAAQSGAHHAQGNAEQDLEPRRHHDVRLADADQSHPHDAQFLRPAARAEAADPWPTSRRCTNELDRAEQETPVSEEKISALKEKLARANAKRKWVGFIDPIDVRFNSFTEQPVPTSQAVMFCLMDVSGSMGEREKDLAKRFYMLLHLFLKRRYKKVDVVFIRHTHDAQEVDEQEFFYSRQSGGTIVSTALDKMLEIQRERYATADWNIYAAQASDGYTQSGDARHCVELLNTADHAALPVLRLYRNPRRARDGSVRLARTPAPNCGAPIARSPRIGPTSPPSASPNLPTFSRSSTSCSRRRRQRREHAALHRIGVGFRHARSHLSRRSRTSR